MPQTGLEEALSDADGVILFDGHCAFCRNVVGMLLRQCPERRLLVCSTRSGRGSAAARAIGGEPADTFAFVTAARVDVGVDAYRRILQLGSRTRWLARIIAVVPRLASENVYDWVARHRPLLSSVWGGGHVRAIPSDRFVTGGA
jgi:predicted DCC family thiol-disulfide oxidoreductase YuxK